MAVDPHSLLAPFNSLAKEECEDAVFKCCGSSRFSRILTSYRPFTNFESLEDVSREIWWKGIDIHGWLDAFAAHPRIGDIEGLRSKFKSTSNWTEGEQSAALQSSNEYILKELFEWNIKYENKFGHVFLICATGKSSHEILASIKERYPNRPIDEIQIAAKEQEKITSLRLRKLLIDLSNKSGFHHKAESRLGNITAHLSPPELLVNSNQLAIKNVQDISKLRPPITTHVLDVTLGKPATDIRITLKKSINVRDGSKLSDQEDSHWQHIGESFTDLDGRSGNLMEPSDTIQPGTYKLTFFTQDYFLKHHGKPGFYPYVNIAFEISPNQIQEHFHVPVLLSPFAFNTYRGS